MQPTRIFREELLGKPVSEISRLKTLERTKLETMVQDLRRELGK